MNETLSNEQLTMWQRVLMGTASHDEEQTVLALCEIDPQRYRELALGLLEERQFTIAVAQVTEEERRPVSHSNTVLLNHSVQHPGVRHNRTWLLAVAAMLLGLLAGWNVDLWMKDDASRQANSASSTSATDTESGSPHALPDTNPLLANSSQAKDDFNLRPLFDDNMKSSLQQAGFEIDESPDVYFVRGNDGSRWYMPTQTTTVRFNGP